ncbi:MAG: PssE/Cps14G family polysaccharide biosynthesis glycosyltransferase [Lachnospiraceae bacterium]
MIFVIVGSQKFQFDRLLKKVDSLIVQGIINEDVYAQIGASCYIPQNYVYDRFLDQFKFAEKIEECDMVITHGGTGAIINALEHNKKVIAVPRLSQYGEHVDDHQVELLEQFGSHKLICYCRDVKELGQCVKDIKQMSFERYESNTKAYIYDIQEYLSRVEKPPNAKMSVKLHKYIEYASTKVKLLFNQKKFVDGEVVINYMHEENHSNMLVIVFSSCTREGVKARYNYVRTLEKIRADKLFVLDDYGYDQRGVYYLGKNMDFFVERAVGKLLKTVIRRGGYKKVICAGSSKGGYGALNFGLKIPSSIIIIGAPQYLLGDYLMDKTNRLEKTLSYITGSGYNQTSDAPVEILNQHLHNKLKKYALMKNKPEIHIQYSTGEHTYKEHIQHLIDDIKRYGFSLEEEVVEYLNHSDVSLYFPDYLVRKVKEVLIGVYK